jgi:hypothetical protein
MIFFNYVIIPCLKGVTKSEDIKKYIDLLLFHKT